MNGKKAKAIRRLVEREAPRTSRPEADAEAIREMARRVKRIYKNRNR